MNIKVKKLYDIAKVVVPKEMTMWKVTDEEIQEQLKTLSMLSAEERDADTAETGDCVKCFCLSGGLKDRTVLIYPGKEIPGAEEAEQAVMGITVGTEFAVELNGEQELKVEKIIRRIPVVVDDALVQKQNIQGVSTVDEYCEWYRQTTGEINREQALKQIKIYYLEAMAEKSELEYDKAEMEIWVEGQVQQYVAEMEAMGQKEELSEEMLGQMKEQCAASRFGEAVAKAICEEQGIFFTADMFEDELKQMAEEMPGMEDMLDEYAQMYVGNAYTGKAIELLDEQAHTCPEV